MNDPILTPSGGPDISRKRLLAHAASAAAAAALGLLALRPREALAALTQAVYFGCEHMAWTDAGISVVSDRNANPKKALRFTQPARSAWRRNQHFAAEATHI